MIFFNIVGKRELYKAKFIDLLAIWMSDDQTHPLDGKLLANFESSVYFKNQSSGKKLGWKFIQKYVFVESWGDENLIFHLQTKWKGKESR